MKNSYLLLRDTYLVGNTSESFVNGIFYCDVLMQVNQFSGASVPVFQFNWWFISSLIKL